MHDFPDLSVVFRFHELVVDGALHRRGLVARHLHHVSCNVLVRHWLTSLGIHHLLTRGRVNRRLLTLAHPHHLGVRCGLDAPVAVVGWQQNVREARLGAVRLLTCHANEHCRSVGLGVVDRYGVALFDTRHHLTGRTVDVVLGVVLVFVIKPALVHAIAGAAPDPLVALLRQARTEGLQAILVPLLCQVGVGDVDLHIHLWLVGKVHFYPNTRLLCQICRTQLRASSCANAYSWLLLGSWLYGASSLRNGLQP